MHDMLNIRLIGQTATESFIKHTILGQSSITNSIIRRKRLLTMSTKKISKKGVSAKNRENNRVIKCLKRRLAWCNHTGQAFQSEHEQYSFFPRALVDENRIPHKSPKSHWTDKLQTRYRESTLCVFSNVIDVQWVPQTIIIDAMFIINMKYRYKWRNRMNYLAVLVASMITPAPSMLNAMKMRDTSLRNIMAHYLNQLVSVRNIKLKPAATMPMRKGMPSITALQRHWLRSTYICNLWSNATQHDVYAALPLPENSGLILRNAEFFIDWEDPEEQPLISQNVSNMKNGCQCKTGCSNAIC